MNFFHLPAKWLYGIKFSVFAYSKEFDCGRLVLIDFRFFQNLETSSQHKASLARIGMWERMNLRFPLPPRLSYSGVSSMAHSWYVPRIFWTSSAPRHWRGLSFVLFVGTQQYPIKMNSLPYTSCLPLHWEMKMSFVVPFEALVLKMWKEDSERNTSFRGWWRATSK